ncbi:hypothetical protein ACFFRR_007069 [Megaselia abdita]
MEKIILVLVSAIICPAVVFGAALSKTVLYQAPDECKWSGFSENDIVLVCSLRTINSELERTNFSVIQAQNTVRLRLECNEGLYYRSSLGDGSFATLSELRELTIDYCKLSNISDGAFRGLSDLRNLTIRTHNSDWSTMRLQLSSESFNEFRQLDFLDLSLNNIWNIPEGLLCPLKILTHLNMSFNEIQDLSNFHFSASLTSRKSRICGSSLTQLNLSDNKITNLSSAVFSALVRLKKLNLARNNMNYIADRALEGLVSLTTIDLSENQLTSLPPELFSETKSIKEIYLRNNSINVLAPGIFSELADLLVLDLAKNELNSQWINIATFAGLKRLVFLDLSSNKINKLEPSIFRNLRSLQVLQLSENYIDSIPENTFVELTNLHTLVLSHNRLTNIGPMTFYGLFGISILSLDFNRINKIDAIAFKNCSSLQELHINSNKLQRVPEALSYVPLLKTLDIGENLITNIENTSLNLLESLYGLRLTENLIDIIKRGVFDRMKSLQILNLSKNKIRHIEPGSFHKNIQLQAIRLDENHLKSIAGLFNELPTLMLLNISNNHMEKFDYSHIPNRLQWLDISANRINELSNYFEIESDISLTTFDASSNRLTEVTANSIPNSVEVLSLKNNHITTIQPYTFFKKPNLTSVDLFGNKLTTLEPNALRLSPVPAHKTIPEFSIGGNPFKCDCNLDWVQKVNIESRTQPKLMDLSTIQCYLPYNGNRTHIPLLEAKSSELLCKYESHCFALCHCCDFSACDCKMECPSGCSCHHDQSWTANVVVCSSAGYNMELPSHIPMDSTQLYLDGNDIRELSSHTFLGRKRLRVLHLNNSNVQVVQNRTFYGLIELEILQLDHNKLDRINGNEFFGLDNLKELYLQHNSIRTIDNMAFAHLHHLQILRLDHNAIVDFAVWSFLPSYMNDLRLAGNPWNCQCNFVSRFKDYLHRHNFIQDRYKIKCTANNNSLEYYTILSNPRNNELDVEQKQIPCGPYQPNNNDYMDDNHNNISNDNNPHNHHTNNIIENANFSSSTKLVLTQQPILDYVPILVTILGSFLFVIIFTIILFIFRQEMRVWFHSRFGVRLFCNANKDIDKSERDKLFDAFISYSSKDEEFVTQYLAPSLENGDAKYKLCLHHRNFPVGGYMADTIMQAIDTSKRTIMVLSENFIRSEWCKFEFKSAHHHVLRDRRKRLIVILLGELPEKDLDPEIKLYLKNNTYLQWGDKLFWEKLRYALPDVPNNQRRYSSAAQQMLPPSSDYPNHIYHHPQYVTVPGNAVPIHYSHSNLLNHHHNSNYNVNVNMNHYKNNHHQHHHSSSPTPTLQMQQHRQHQNLHNSSLTVASSCSSGAVQSTPCQSQAQPQTQPPTTVDQQQQQQQQQQYCNGTTTNINNNLNINRNMQNSRNTAVHI